MDIKDSKKFSDLVYDATSKIPKGKIATYKQIAVAIGKPNSSRAVGQALKNNPNAPGVPCHRVIASDGKISGYFKTKIDIKQKLLAEEGIIFKNGKLNKSEMKLYCVDKL